MLLFELSSLLQCLKLTDKSFFTQHQREGQPAWTRKVALILRRILPLQIHRLGVSIISSAAVGVAAAGVAIATLNPAAFFTFIVRSSHRTSACSQLIISGALQGSLVTLIGTAITLKKALTERGGQWIGLPCGERY